ncbi:MAG TPA: succinate dehydrogenase [Candidatus Krumholzibacteria bacterium]|jgi:hypothetical protein|nr:succinate dehydrogenase [Candidatus Krumholzibacteria bacterium]
MATTQLPVLGGHPERFGATVRTDRWWVAPAATVFVLFGFVVYATWAAFQAQHYYAAPYLSPFYSPLLFTNTSAAGSAPVWHALFGEWPTWWPAALPSSPAFLILIFPGLFRFTCYYYRKAYYRSFAASPPACAVVPLGKTSRPYKGETGLLVFQNLHRYALYFALPYVPILFADAIASFLFEGRFGIGVGSLVLTVNACLLAGYTFGCHSFRHLIGGHDDCMSCGRATPRYRFWKFASWFNARHMRFAWFSLFWVAFTDVYVRLVSMGIWHDFNTWH